jgi:hypothetical protein
MHLPKSTVIIVVMLLGVAIALCLGFWCWVACAGWEIYMKRSVEVRNRPGETLYTWRHGDIRSCSSIDDADCAAFLVYYVPDLSWVVG